MIKKITYYVADSAQNFMDSKSFLDLNLAIKRKQELNKPDLEIFQYIKEYKNKDFKNKFEKELEIIKQL